MHKRNRRAQRPVVSRAEQADHNVRNHDAARSAQQQRRKKISQAQHERKRRSREHARNRQRKDHLPKCLRRRRSQIMRGLNQIARNMLQRRVNRQKRERRIDMRERQHHRKRTVEQKVERMPGQMHILQQRIQHAVRAKNRLPCIRPHQIADPQRNDHHLIEQVFSLAARKTTGNKPADIRAAAKTT